MGSSSKFHIPIAGKIIYKATLARFARSLALAFKSGIPIVQGLNVVGMWWTTNICAPASSRCATGVERGESISRTAMADRRVQPRRAAR